SRRAPLFPSTTLFRSNALCPSIGGVLIRGEKGTAKSTAARALRAILPPIASVQGCPFHCDPHHLWADCPHCAALENRTTVELPRSEEHTSELQSPYDL